MTDLKIIIEYGLLPTGGKLLPTPRTTDSHGSGDHGSGGQDLRTACSTLDGWGPYEPAIRRWETVTGRPAPQPTEPNKNGRPRLTAEFDEWIMGVPEGWITGLDSIPYGAKMKMCGNGVVPQQALLALHILFDDQDLTMATGPG